MSAQSQPSFDLLVGRTFSLYPAIRNIEHNEWRLERETWSEVLISNVKTGQEVWIPRNYVGKISSADEPVLIVGLNRELEFKAGAVWPFQKRVLEMPGPRRVPAARAEKEPSGPPSGARLTSAAESKIGRFVAGALAVGLAACLILVLFVSDGLPDPLAWFTQVAVETADQRYLGLTGADGYHDIVIKIGEPEKQQWITPADAQLQFQLLSYASRSYAVVMLGSGRGDARYIGTIHLPTRRLLDSVRLSGGGSTASMIRNLPEF